MSFQWVPPPGTRRAVARVTAEILRIIAPGCIAGELGVSRPRILAGGDCESGRPSTILWGCGLSGPSTKVPPVTSDRVLAVRGMLTADRMVAAGIRLRDIPLGDPGLLAGEVLASDRIAQIAPIVVVPATGNQRHPFFSTLRDSREIQIVNLDTDSLDPLRAIAGADCVVSQDVYGLVYAAAFGKPAVWIADRSDAEHDFRFRDLMSTMCEKIDRPILLGGSVEILARYAARVNYQRSIQALADCIQSLPHQDKS